MGSPYFDPESDGIEREPYDQKQGLRIISHWFNIDFSPHVASTSIINRERD
jgi:hypothetical protein